MRSRLTERIISPPRLNGCHRLEQLAAAPERADPARAAELVGREGEEVAAERLHVDRPVRRRLRRVDDHDRALLVRPGGEPLDRVDRAERVGDEAGRDDLDRALAREPVERVELELAGVVDRDVAEARARLAGDELPGDEVRVVLELGDHDGVAGAEVLEPPGVGDEVDRLGRAAGEDHLALGRRVDERGDRAPGALVALRGALCEPVDAAMDVRVLVLVERAHPVEHLPRLLRRRRRVEIRERLAVDLLLEEREVGAKRGGIEGARRC